MSRPRITSPSTTSSTEVASDPPRRWSIDPNLAGRLLAVDVAACVGLGLLALVAGLVGGSLADPFGASPVLLAGTGVSLLAYAAGAAPVARSRRRTGLLAVAAANLAFAVAAAVVAVVVPLTPLGLVAAGVLAVVPLLVADVGLLAARRR